ncbi:MAG: ribosome maturation factor RimP [Mycobacterium sp.]
MTERSRGLPAPHEVIELLGGEFAQAGYEIDDVRVDAARKPARIVVTVDGDIPLDLDTVAELSRVASERLDTLADTLDAYLLEVSSPGVERPLTQEKHYRRAHGRKVELTLAAGEQLTGRIAGVLTENGIGLLRLVVPGKTKGSGTWSVRELPLAEIVKAVVQVDFSPPNQRELDLVGQAGTEAGA